MNSVVMAGSLLSFDVPSLLQAVSLSRQYTLIRLWDRERRPTGEIRLKAGQLVDATGGGQRGKQGFYAILRFKNHYTFRVERLSDPGNLPEPVGPLARLLLAMPPAPVSAVSHASTPPAPPPTAASSTAAAPRLAPADPAPSESTPRGAAPVHVDAGDSGPAGTPSPVSMVAPVNLSPTASGPRRIALNAMPQSVHDALERVDGLLVALVFGAAQARCCARWHRAVVPVPISALAGFATRWLLAHRQSFGTTVGRPRGVIELAEGTFLIDPVSDARVVGYFFATTVPQGLVRWQVSRLASAMSGFQIDGETEPAPSASSSSLRSPLVTA